MGKNAQQKTGTILVRPSVVREFSSGGVVFKKKKGEILWLVTKNNPSELYPEEWWRLPKGRIDNLGNDQPGPMALGKIKADEASLQSAAVREVKEEGGVEAKVVKKIGTEKYFFGSRDRGKILKFVTFYLMKWIKNFPEGYGEETSEVLWLPYEKAYKKLSYGGEKKILKKAKEILDQGVQNNLPL